ncbi:MAG: carbon starvation protein A [Planctomycetota bacterium]
MNVAVMVLISLVVSAFGYFVYARLVSRWLGVDPNRRTPAHTMSDGVDYVPSRAPVLFGHHFASIAGAGPIVGPVIAAAYGWLPAFLWVLIGVVFMGAMFDFAVIIASVRHEGKSIGEVIEANVGMLGKKLFLCFCWFALILVTASFTNIVATTFVEDPAVATASILFIFLAVGFGFAVYRRGVPLSIATIVGVICVALCVFISDTSWLRLDLSMDAKVDGALATLNAEGASSAEKADAEKTIKQRAAEMKARFKDDDPVREIARKAKIRVGANRWSIPILIYIFIASVTPVWLVLQPRDYLNSFLLYAMLAVALVSVLVARPTVLMPAVATLNSDRVGLIFPFLFVTVACGAISGFHSLVGSGTTSKQISNERHARPIGYGGMLIEGILAVLALGAVAVLPWAEFMATPKGGEVVAFSTGIAGSMQSIGISPQAGASFILLAVSCFALTSLDTGTRIARYAFQEFFEGRSGARKNILAGNRYVGTAVTVVLAGLLARKGVDAIWPIFGSANQLLAALGLLAISVWLAKRGRQNLFTIIPMGFMFIVTLTALSLLIYTRFQKQEYALTGVACVLFVLAVVLTIVSIKHLSLRMRTTKEEPQTPS